MNDHFAVEDFKEPYMLFYIIQTCPSTKDKTETEIYDCTRQFWHGVSRKKRETKPLPYPVALAVVGSVVERAYSVDEWVRAGTTPSTRTNLDRKNRWEFTGHLLNDHFLIGRFLTKGSKPLLANQCGHGYFGPLPKVNQR